MAAMDKVKAAAAFLDRYCEYDWRNKVSTYRLNMYDCKDCILGQVYGDYEDGSDILGDVDYDGFLKVQNAFCKYTNEWKEYLNMQKPESSITPKSVWMLKAAKNTQVTISHTFRENPEDKLHVVYSCPGQFSYMVNSAEKFLQNFELKPVYNEGQLYRGKCGDILMYSATADLGSPGFYNLSSSSYCDVAYFEKNYSPIVPLKAALNADKTIFAKIG